MFFGAFFILAILLGISLLVPFRRKTLITGEFIFETKGINLLARNEKLWRGFYFEKYCLECYQSGRKPLSIKCFDGVPLAAHEKSSFKPQRGDYVRLDVWETIWGKRKAYSVSLVTNSETIRLIKEGREKLIQDLCDKK